MTPSTEQSVSAEVLNPGQQRKIRIIEKTFGSKWAETYPGMAIDAIYNRAIKDDRKSLFCKIDSARKDKLSEMLDFYDTTIGDYIGMLIDHSFEKYAKQRRDQMHGIAEDYSGS